MNLVAKAIMFADAAHEGQVRDDGKPYIVHPHQTADIIQCITDDEELIAAAWLHDTIEDTPVTYAMLKLEFGTRVADLVDEVTHEGNDSTGYYFPRLKTRDGALLKFADRLSNLSNMNGWSEKRREHYLKKSKFWRSE